MLSQHKLFIEIAYYLIDYVVNNRCRSTLIFVSDCDLCLVISYSNLQLNAIFFLQQLGKSMEMRAVIGYNGKKKEPSFLVQ